MAPNPALDRRLRRQASALTPAWLSAQRWYRGKSRRLVSVELVDAAPIDGGPGWLLVLAAIDAAEEVTRYLVPVAADGDAFREPRDEEGVWRGLAACILEGGDLEGAHGRWVFTPTRAAAGAPPVSVAALAELAERRLGVQQTNSSVALGAELMLKVYRALEPGVNPEVEVNAFLTAAGFGQAPALLGSASYLLDGETHSAAMLQRFVPSSGDAWNWVLGSLAASADGPAEAISGIAWIGAITAQLHAALASNPDAPGFPVRAATPEELVAWRAAAEGQLEAALAVMDAEPRARLEAIAPRIAAQFEAIGSASGARVSRIHGDYHLGQLLRTHDGFVVIDFEGEPARSLPERRAPASPLRDVAGMLRSLDYAAHATDSPARHQGGRPAWLGEARTAFLAGYGGIATGDEPLLAALELEKACYEVRYEANNRPDWVWLPLDALERLAHRSQDTGI